MNWKNIAIVIKHVNCFAISFIPRASQTQKMMQFDLLPNEMYRNIFFKLTCLKQNKRGIKEILKESQNTAIPINLATVVMVGIPLKIISLKNC